MVHGNSERFSKALVSNLKPDLVLAVPNDLFCVTDALQLLIVHFIAIKSLHVLITATFFCIFFQLPLDFILDYIFFFFFPLTRPFIPFIRSLVNSPGRSQERCEKCSADDTHPV